MKGVSQLERIRIKNKSRMDGELLWSVVSSEPFRKRLQEAGQRTDATGREVAFFVLKEMGEDVVTFTNLKQGKKTKVDIDFLGNLCFDAEEMRYRRYPLIAFHTHPDVGYLAPSGTDFMSMLVNPKEWAAKELFKIQPILWVSRMTKSGEVESLLVQDKTGIFETTVFLDEPKENIQGYTSAKMGRLHNKICDLHEAKKATTEAVAALFAKAGFATAVSRNENELKALLSRFAFKEIDRYKEVPLPPRFDEDGNDLLQ